MTVRATRYLLPTLRDAPGDAVAESHKLLVRAGMVKQVGAGMWTWLPLGWRVKKRVQEIIREEMDRIGGQEMLMPVLHPAEIWKRSGRYDIDVVFHLRDRADRELVLAITHEEIVALHASQTIRSYRDLPQIWYHIQIKERDEPRPQGGVLRTREFTMKDSYTLDRDQAGLDEGYAKHEEAYDRIYRRCGLDVLQGRVRHRADGRQHGARVHGAVERGRGSRGALQRLRLRRQRRDGRLAHRSRALAAERGGRRGRDARRDDDRRARAASSASTRARRARRCRSSPTTARSGSRSCAATAACTSSSSARCSSRERARATPEEIEAAFGAKPGSIGPVGIREGAIGGIVADETLREGAWVTGANRTGWHLTGVEAARDYQAMFADLHEVETGDACPHCGGVLTIEPMIEIGNIFKLGTSYAEAMGATYLDELGAEQPIWMGSYGIGPARIAAAAIEQSFDEHGCIWPAPIAPFDVWIVAIGNEAPAHADRLAAELEERGLTCMVDDREGSPGVRFADADLIGAPLRVTVGKRTVNDGTVDVRQRRTGESETVALATAADRIAAVHDSLMPKLP